MSKVIIAKDVTMFKKPFVEISGLQINEQLNALSFFTAVPVYHNPTRKEFEINIFSDAYTSTRTEYPSLAFLVDWISTEVEPVVISVAKGKIPSRLRNAI